MPRSSVVSRLRQRLAERNRRTFATLPTPLTRLADRTDTPIWIKRDDLIGPWMGGNKVRKLEFLIGDALARDADTLLTVGAAQSNHARITAGVGAMIGLPTHLVLGGPATRPEGNQLLAQLFGATTHHPGTDDWGELEAFQQALAQRLVDQGRRPYTIPVGGSTAVGALGFVAAFDELMAQCCASGFIPDVVVHASSTGGTHAGLLAGQACYRADGWATPDIVAISVAKTGADLARGAEQLASEALALLDLADVPLPSSAVRVDSSWLGTAYAEPTKAGDEALLFAARSSGILLDRVYTAKAFAACRALVEGQQWGRDAHVVFWHTGGNVALFSAGGVPPAPSSTAAYPQETTIRRVPGATA
jgi:1-aminocyclopropane-1-carboxylate deaminase/D-cysteine desulfhydrase-like pyridoxal-dependent ACC family enzyme